MHGRAVGHQQPGHVLHHSDDALTGLQRDSTGALGDLCGRNLWSGHHQDFRTREQLGHRDRHIAGTRWQVEQQDIEVSPVHISQELLQRPVQHRPAPRDRGIALGELSDRDDLHVVRDGGQDHRFDLSRPVVRSHHPGHGVAVDISVEQTDREATRRHCRREIDCDA